MRRWLEEDNKGTQILGICWLLQEPRRAGKAASSLVVYLKDTIDTNRELRMGRKILRTIGRDRRTPCFHSSISLCLVSKRGGFPPGLLFSVTPGAVFLSSGPRVHFSLLARGARLTWPSLESTSRFFQAVHYFS